MKRLKIFAVLQIMMIGCSQKRTIMQHTLTNSFRSRNRIMFTESSVRNDSVAIILPLITPLLLALLSAVHADEPSSDWEKQIETRRAEYLQWIVENFGKLEPTMDPQDGRRWALNHARLVLNRDVDEANGYFESFGPLPRDRDIYLIRFLRTLLDFRDSPRLSDEAEARIVGHIKTGPGTTGAHARTGRRRLPRTTI